MNAVVMDDSEAGAESIFAACDFDPWGCACPGARWPSAPRSRVLRTPAGGGSQRLRALALRHIESLQAVQPPSAEEVDRARLPCPGCERPRSGAQGPDSSVRGVNDTSRKGKDGISLATRKTVPKTPVPGSCFSRFILLHHCRPPGLLKFQNCLSGDERSSSWNGRTTQACPPRKCRQPSRRPCREFRRRIPAKSRCKYLIRTEIQGV